MEHELTPKQQECVDYKGADLLVRGIPGSGKSVVLLRKARKLAEESRGTATVRVFTYGRTLAKYARDLVQRLNVPGIDVVSFHSWAGSKLYRLGVKSDVMKEKDRKKIIRDLLQAQQARSTSKVLANDLEFWLDEIAWIKGKMIEDLATYQRVERVGRGAALRAPEREVVWGIFEQYQQALARQRKIDWEDFAPELWRRIDRLPESEKIDHVLVDEAQDLHEIQLKLLKRVSRQTMTIVADEAQKIFKTSFTWSNLGINIRGSGSKRLTTSFRSTRQIIALAADLRKRDRLVKDSGPDGLEYELPEATGPLPILVPIAREKAEDEFVVKLVKSLVDSSRDATTGKGTKTIGVLARQWDLLEQIQDVLKRGGIESERIEQDRGSVVTPGVKLTTFHSVKGLEFDYVIAMRLNEGVIPPAPPASMEGDDLEEFLGPERRLLYVSMTRAKYMLFLTHSQPPSRFLAELDPDLYRRFEG